MTHEGTAGAVQRALDGAGAVLRELGETVVLLAFHRGSRDADDRFTVRLEVGGTQIGVQESACTPAQAYAKAAALRLERAASLAREAAVREELQRRQSA